MRRAERTAGHTSASSNRLAPGVLEGMTDTTIPAPVRDQLDALRTAAKEAADVLEMSLGSVAVSVNDEAVKALGVRIGYGAMMHIASRLWSESLRAKGYPSGGQFISGPCYSTAQKIVAQLRAALEGSSSATEVARAVGAESKIWEDACHQVGDTMALTLDDYALRCVRSALAEVQRRAGRRSPPADTPTAGTLKTKAEVAQLCREWKPGSPEDYYKFKIIVVLYLALGEGQRHLLADKFEVIPWTVVRWATGEACPLPGMQQAVVAWILTQVEA